MDDKMFDVILSRMHDGFKGVHSRLDTLHRDVIEQGKEIAKLEVRTTNLEQQMKHNDEEHDRARDSGGLSTLFNSPVKAGAWVGGGLLGLFELLPRLVEYFQGP